MQYLPSLFFIFEYVLNQKTGYTETSVQALSNIKHCKSLLQDKLRTWPIVTHLSAYSEMANH